MISLVIRFFGIQQRDQVTLEQQYCFLKNFLDL